MVMGESMKRWSVAVAVFVGALSVSGAAGAGAADPWAAVRQPVSGGVQSLGSPAAGCIAGAVALPADGIGYQVLRVERNRFWAHPRTVAFVEELGRRAKGEGIGPLLIGDLSQPRGGPMAYGHGSHQNGLDVDIWFRLPAAPLTEGERARPQPISMVRGTSVDARSWRPEHLRMLELAASAPEVDRIFVNPAIKVAACAQARGNRAWLAKLRPWWGHDEHFHVRLTCAADEPGCVPQAAVPDGDGCGAELASWNAKPTLLPESAKDRPNHRRPVLPAACAALLGRPDVHEAGVR